jgi:hypothetical protein
MSERIAEIRDVLARDHAEMRALFEQLTPENMQLPAGSDGWTVAQLAGHIAVSPRGQILFLNRLRKGRGVVVPAPLTFIINIRNWWMTRRFKQTTRDELLSTLEASYGDLLAAVETLTEEELDRGGNVLTSGYQTLYENLKSFGGDHGREHAAVLRSAAGLTAPTPAP